MIPSTIFGVAASPEALYFAEIDTLLTGTPTPQVEAYQSLWAMYLLLDEDLPSERRRYLWFRTQTKEILNGIIDARVQAIIDGTGFDA